MFVVTAGFCALVATRALDPLDRTLLVALRYAVGENGLVVALAHAGTWVGQWQVRIVLAMLLALYVGKRGKVYGMFALVMSSVSIGYITDEWLKLLFRRPRPDLVQHLTLAEGWSMPSGHAAGSVATFALAAWLMAEATTNRRAASALRWCGVAAAVVVGGSRAVLGVHWPSDIVAGWLVGAFVAIVSVEISRYVTRGSEVSV